MKKKKLFLIVYAVIAVLVLLASPVLAATQQAVEVATGYTIDTTVGSFSGVGTSPIRQTFYAQGRNWLFYVDEDSGNQDIVYTSAAPGEDWETPTVLVNDCGLYAIEFAVFYDIDTGYVHFARHDMDPVPDEVVYRMGTPGTDGSITWVATEQTVSQTPADLLTWRTTIAVDEAGYPWVAWIDTDGVNPEGIVYVEASITKNGTWTQSANVSANFTLADHHCWYVSLTPVGNYTADVMEVEFSREDQTGGINDGDVGLYAYLYDGSTETWSGEDTIADLGDMNATRPDGFSLYDIGSSLYCAYTDPLGSILIIARSSIQSWNGTAAAAPIKEIPGELLLPTLSGYANAIIGDDMLCIIHSESTLYYATHDFGDNITDWNTWTTIWTVNDSSDNITRHIANYKYSSPIGFAWQVSEDTAQVDTVYTWWIDNENGLGWYLADAGTELMQVVLPIIIALSIIVFTVVLFHSSPTIMLIGLMVGILAFYLVRAMVDTL